MKTHRLLAVATALALAGCGESTPSNPSTDAGDVVATDAQGDDVARVDTTTDAASQDVLDDQAQVLDARGDVPPTDDVLVTDAPADAPADATDDVPAVTDAADAALDVPDASDVHDVPADVALDAVLDVPTDVPVDVVLVSACDTLRASITLPAAAATTVTATTSGASTIPSTSCQSNAGGPEHVYPLVVTARTGVQLDTLTAVPGGFDTVLSLRRACGDLSTEVACSDDASTSTTRSRIRTVLEPGSYSVVVDGYNTASGAYTLAVQSFDAPANALCATATALTSGVAATGDVAGGTNPSTSCLASSNGDQVYYTVTLPAGASARVTVTPSGAAPTWRPVVRVLPGCADNTCLASAAATSDGGPVTTSVSNSTGVARSYVVAVASTAPVAAGAFAITATVTMDPMGSTCAAAFPLVSAVPMTDVNATTVGARPDIRCASSSAGNVVWFRVTVPGFSRATFRAVPTGATLWRPTIRVIDGCAATACFDFRTAAADGPTVLAVDNEGYFPRDFAVGVSGATTAAAGVFTMTYTASALGRAYAVSAVAAACDDTAGGAAVSFTTSGDDAASAVAALPFPFTYYGQTTLGYSVSTNGFAQLWPAVSGAPSTAYANVDTPFDAHPDALLAPFWDDLYFQSTASLTSARTRTVGASPDRRFVIEWNNWRFFGGDQSLRFQVKLFETSHAIEFHYCAMTPTTQPRVLGDSATIGLTAPAGVTAAPLQVAYNRAAAVDPARAYRFVPSP